MKRYFIEEAKCGVAGGGMACGPFPGVVAVTIRFRSGKKTQWMNLVEVDGLPAFYLADRDLHEEIIRDEENEELREYMEHHFIESYNDLDLTEDYDNIFSGISEDPENPAVPLIRYAIALARCEMEEVSGLIEMARGHYADELEIPMSDAEEEFNEENDL